MENTATVQPQKLSMKSKCSYCGGGIGRDMAYNLVNAQILSFLMLTRSLNDAQLLVITVIMVCCRIFDGLNDPIMGAIIEATHNAKGKFKPWMLLGVCTNVCVIMAIYGVPIKGWEYVIFFAFAYLLWGITFTMNDISYWSMLPSLSTDKKERDGLSSWANLLAGVGAGIASGVIPLLSVGDLALIKSSISYSYLIMAGVICVCFLVCQLITYFGTAHKSTLLPPDMPKPKFENPLKDMWKVIKTNDQLRWVALVMLLYNIGASMLSGAITIYIYLTFGFQGMLVTVFTVLFGFAGGVPMLFYGAFSKRMTRRQMAMFAIITATLGYVLFFCTGVVWKTGLTTSGGLAIGDFVLLALCGILINIGQCLFYNVQTISISNCIEYNEFLTGERKEGIIFAIRPLMAKIGSAIQLGIITLIYVLLGVNSFTNQISRIDGNATMGLITAAEKEQQILDVIGGFDYKTGVKLKAWICALSILLVVASCLIMRKKCTITEKKYEEILVAIKERKEGGAAEKSDETTEETEDNGENGNSDSVSVSDTPADGENENEGENDGENVNDNVSINDKENAVQYAENKGDTTAEFDGQNTLKDGE